MTPDFTDEQQILALTLFGEIRGGSDRAIAHVASVIQNRAQHPRWWGKSILTVCLARWQFSCWWLQDANHLAMLAVPPGDAAFLRCDKVAAQVLGHSLIDDTQQSDSYFAVNSPPPAWADRARATITDGWHDFYRLELSDVPHSTNPGAPTGSIHTVDTVTRADDLNQLQLDRLAALSSINPLQRPL